MFERHEAKKRGARGFALPEVLISAAIAAAMLAASASALSTSLRGARAASETADIIQEAENIAARLKAGSEIDDLIGDEWEVTRAPHETSEDALRSHYLETVTVSRTTSPALTFHVYVIKETKR
ncbi:MAG: prepilin-type N-terminal cleavage/methylation domain-containing protein [Pseudomonadota bacterium]